LHGRVGKSFGNRCGAQIQQQECLEGFGKSAALGLRASRAINSKQSVNMRVESTFVLRPGELAPKFSLPDAGGDVYDFSKLLGSGGLLVCFACNHCPYVVHVASSLGAWAKGAAARGVNTVAIVSNDLAAYPQDGPEFMPGFAEKHGWDFPYLIDADQAVAKAYAAACTPDFFLLNNEGRLYYAGQFDETRPKGEETAHGGTLQKALDAMLRNDPEPDVTQAACGCNIKWIPGQEPSWFPV
jgi:peroxiredoxin